ncbi:TolC family protein [Fibrobacter sp. UWB13]|uniref:TolC family protein n=1 Tax=Fibrobacter sp. UWB13 TaxID=1896204 RepID=UPI000A0BED8C|nr:TolC family protein [Fibrobacter sp. UWB13]SMG23769.1 Outer membrane efflux protein [Fibrobacter sp. UWB13]
MKTVSFLTLALTAAAIASPLTWERLIESAKADPRYEAAEKRAEATSKERNLKLWDKVELRYQLDGFSFAKHDFELRVTPQAFGERAADKAHYEAVKNYQQATFAVERSILLYDRYERGVRYVLRQKINEINKQLLQVIQDRIEVLHLKSGSASFNAEDLMTSLEKSASLKANLLSDSTALRDAELKMLSWAPDYDNVNLDSSFLPTMEELAEFLKNGVTVDESFPLVALAKGKRDSDISKAQQDASKDRNYISHVGIGYSLQVESLMEKYKDLEYKDIKSGARYDEYESEWMSKACTQTVQGECASYDASYKLRKLFPDTDNRKTADKFFVNLAFRLPFFDSNKDASLREQVEKLDAESKYLDEVREVNQKVARLTEEVLTLIDQWKVLKDYAEQVNASGFMEQFAHKAGSDPLLLLRARESALESDLKAAKLEYDIYARYLELLDFSGGLAREGVVNHLREGIR